ncbi:hypothetical protein BU24DRAFT_478652 [Aaosphaeria arxii CBS 175.79]|uniref:Uncharacterized protein n=1 Tax=Aaosphaeria arxii CBS 175.79 TaxID=1450172 RepID=A0A6A5XXJ2_9PLEO|nr:uncharacterized protein BU24DRAFT_478652 [Aaosphaeria arxii CBS 175.79]KAF2017547.1 hypothetical protein BU24DRAFT_478652 [Aaosphaeria arxii CBS 175.79]
MTFPPGRKEVNHYTTIHYTSFTTIVIIVFPYTNYTLYNNTNTVQQKSLQSFASILLRVALSINSLHHHHQHIKMQLSHLILATLFTASSLAAPTLTPSTPTTRPLLRRRPHAAPGTPNCTGGRTFPTFVKFEGGDAQITKSVDEFMQCSGGKLAFKPDAKDKAPYRGDPKQAEDMKNALDIAGLRCKCA